MTSSSSVQDPRFAELSGCSYSERPLYFDYNATTPVDPEVLDEILPFFRDEFGNPSSHHAYGRRAKLAIERARSQVASLIGCAEDEIVFTSGGTESTNLALRGVAYSREGRRHIVTSSFEHPATAKTCEWLERRGFRVSRAAVRPDGCIDSKAIARLIDDDAQLVTLIHAHNELGTIQPISEVAQLARQKGAFLHCDAAQTVGKVAVDVDALGVDLLTIAGHKVYAPKGVGALYVRKGTPFRPALAGAGHERGRRPGSENVAGIVGLGKACEIAGQRMVASMMQQRGLREHLLGLLRNRVPGLVLHGESSSRLPNTLFLTFPGIHGTRLLAAVPDIAASTGSACHSELDGPCAALLAMGLSVSEATGPVRLSLGRGTTVEDVERAAERLGAAWRELKGPLERADRIARVE
jgi:cysteine desulfurase